MYDVSSFYSDQLVFIDETRVDRSIGSMARVALLEESGHVKSSDFTVVRDSKSSLPILKMVLYIS
jgi:hypothetical protein